MSRTPLLSVISLLVLCAALLTSPGFAEEDRKCRHCDNTGKIPVKPFDETPDMLLDSERLNYPSGDLGLGWKPCERGEDIHPEATEAAKSEFEAVRKKLETFLEERQRAYDFLIFGPGYEKHEVNHIETENHRVVSTLEGCRIFRKSITGHQRTRLYCMRVEDCYSYFRELLAIPDYKPSVYGKYQLLMWGKVDQQLKASNKMVGNTQYPLATGNARLLTITPFEPQGGRPAGYSDDRLHHDVVHNMVHIYCEEWDGWVDGCFPMWFYEGVSHWIEYRTFARVASYCTDEGGELHSARDKHWERLVYKLLKKGKDTPLLQLSPVKIQDLDFDMRLKGWALVDWMFHQGGGEKIRTFLKVLKKSKNEAQAWRDSFGLTMQEADDKWKEWAIEHYSPRNWQKFDKENDERVKKFEERQLELLGQLPY
ncbi:MAG: hypothetical protein U5N86_06990 [Planctomycetota bacterium]|nr:hypothetical protein [Planctomycetota bacterium]